MGIGILEIEQLLGSGLSTYDPYDLWKTKFGRSLKKHYYKKGRIAIPILVPFALLDTYAPQCIRKFIKPQEYPIVRALAVLTALNIYEITSDKKYIELAEQSVNWLKNNQSPGYHGACWGLNFHWMTKSGCYPPTTPFITHTPYCVEALLKYHDITEDLHSYETAVSVLDFLESDMKVLFEDFDCMAMGYGPGHEKRIVVNANSYSMMLYALLAKRVSKENDVLLEKAERLFNYVKSCQSEDGKWLYYSDNGQGNFVDCFHSCFVLKNLIKYSMYTGDNVDDVVSKGLDYIVNNFIDPETSMAKRFTLSANPSIVKYDLYDQAELLNVLILTGQISLADKLYESTINNFYIPKKKNFGCQIDMFGYLNKMPYLRWGILPMIYVLSEYYKRKQKYN